jgi:hypothetical protein
MLLKIAWFWSKNSGEEAEPSKNRRCWSKNRTWILLKIRHPLPLLARIRTICTEASKNSVLRIATEPKPASKNSLILN